MAAELMGLALFMKRTDKNGLESITEHWVWDAKRFMEARADEVKKEGGKASAIRITKAEFVAATKPRNP